jgi:hypothetical protein
MVKAFSLGSWNVEHFQNASRRVDRVGSVLTNRPRRSSSACSVS